MTPMRCCALISREISSCRRFADKKRKGYAGMLLDWLTEHARQQGCQAVHLDTGYARHAAHRVYLGKGFELSSHHMDKSIA